MKIKVLGCSGGIGGPARTTALLIDEDILIDAGTGAADLEPRALAAIDHVFLTHAHLDHIVALPLLLDSVGPHRRQPLIVHAQAATLEVLRTHVFNWQVWPDFSRLPEKGRPYLAFEELPPGDEVQIDGRRLRSIPVNHSVPAVAYLVSGGSGALAFSGDMTRTDAFWRTLNACAELRYLIIETTFVDAQRELSELAKHLCPSMLAAELTKLQREPDIYITHLMPGHEDAIMKEIQHHIAQRTPLRLVQGQTFEL